MGKKDFEAGQEDRKRADETLAYDPHEYAKRQVKGAQSRGIKPNTAEDDDYGRGWCKEPRRGRR